MQKCSICKICKSLKDFCGVAAESGWITVLFILIFIRKYNLKLKCSHEFNSDVGTCNGDESSLVSNEGFVCFVV